jgi:hypothetical protein
MSDLLETAYGNIVSSDLVDRGYRHGQVPYDFLNGDPPPIIQKLGADCIVTNPPFKLAQEFVEHGLIVARHKVCILAKLAFLSSVRRADMLARTPFETVYVFAKRPAFRRNGEHVDGENGGMIDFAWFCWNKDKAPDAEPVIRWIAG